MGNTEIELEKGNNNIKINKHDIDDEKIEIVYDVTENNKNYDFVDSCTKISATITYFFCATACIFLCVVFVISFLIFGIGFVSTDIHFKFDDDDDCEFIMIDSNPNSRGYGLVDSIRVESIMNVLYQNTKFKDHKGMRLQIFRDTRTNEVLGVNYNKDAYSIEFKSLGIEVQNCKSSQFDCGCGYQLLWDNINQSYEHSLIYVSEVLAGVREFNIGDFDLVIQDLFREC